MKFLAILLTGTLAFSSPASAHHYEKLDKPHQDLLHTVEERGVEFFVNDMRYCDEDSDGFYSTNRRLIICQDNASLPGVEVEWTDNDLDTVRHEVHHFLQDCSFGGIKIDHTSTLLFNYGPDFTQFVAQSGLTMEEVLVIERTYEKLGLSYVRIMMEIEAFAVARSITAEQLKQKIDEVCVLTR